MRNFLTYFRFDLSGVMFPNAFHGIGKKGPFFEGWYYKLVSEDGNNRICIIPGIYVGENPNDSHAFIQVLHADTNLSYYVKYSHDSFSSKNKEFDVQIDHNTFRGDYLRLNINREEISLQGELSFAFLNPWPVTFLSPGIMCWYAWVPTMECYHGVVSMDHVIHGDLELNGKTMCFDNGRGYIEKDWGRSMPKTWVWMQSNHFEKQGISLTASIAKIPWRNRSFNGFIVGLLLDGSLYRFATYTGASIQELKISGNTVSVVIQDKQYQLTIKGEKIAGASLQAPTEVQMNRRITESLSSILHVQLTDLKNQSNPVLFEGKGFNAGLEIIGDLF